MELRIQSPEVECGKAAKISFALSRTTPSSPAARHEADGFQITNPSPTAVLTHRSMESRTWKIGLTPPVPHRFWHAPGDIPTGTPVRLRIMDERLFRPD